jgi:hypothetical protein
MNDKKIDDILKKMAGDELPTDIPEIAENLSNDFTRNLAQMRRSRHRPFRELTMRSKTTRWATAALIVCGVVFGVLQFGGPTESVAWGALVDRIQQAHDYYVAQLFRAVEAKDAEEAGRCAVMLEEFWQNLNWLAQAHGDPQSQAQLIAKAQARIERHPQDEDELGTGIFLTHADKFVSWLDSIEDRAWIDETTHVCKQLEDYLEEVRDGARSKRLGLAYIKHCLPSFLAYCQWFEQLPWDDPGRAMASEVLLRSVQRDLEIASGEIQYPAIRCGLRLRLVHRALEQARKNVETLARGGTSEPPLDDARAQVCHKLAQNIDYAAGLVTYAAIAGQNLQQAGRTENDEAFRRVLEQDLNNQGPLKDHLLSQIDQSLELCRGLAEHAGPI